MTSFKQDRKIQVAIAERRKIIAKLLQENISETIIAQRLGVDLSTVSRDIKSLKEQATQFVYDLAKENLAYFYSNTIQDINKARIEAWRVYNSCKDSQKREKLSALKVVISSNVEAFNLLQQGPLIMSVKILNERVEKIELGDKLSEERV